MDFLRLCLFFVTIITICHGRVVSSDNANSIDNTEKSANSSSLVAAEKTSPPAYTPSFQFLPTDLSWKSGVGQALIVGGAIIASILLLGGFTLLLTPVFGYKLCQVFGNCDTVVSAYSANGAAVPQSNPSYNDVYGAYVPAAYANYQKRSLDYVAPILKTLAAAYQKYGQENNKKNE